MYVAAIQRIILGMAEVILLENRKKRIFLGIGVSVFACFVIGLRIMSRISGDYNKETLGLAADVLSLICMIVTWVLGCVFRRRE